MEKERNGQLSERQKWKLKEIKSLRRYKYVDIYIYIMPPELTLCCKCPANWNSDSQRQKLQPTRLRQQVFFCVHSICGKELLMSFVRPTVDTFVPGSVAKSCTWIIVTSKSTQWSIFWSLLIYMSLAKHFLAGQCSVASVPLPLQSSQRSAHQLSIVVRIPDLTGSCDGGWHSHFPACANTS